MESLVFRFQTPFGSLAADHSMAVPIKRLDAEANVPLGDGSGPKGAVDSVQAGTID